MSQSVLARGVTVSKRSPVLKDLHTLLRIWHIYEASESRLDQVAGGRLDSEPVKINGK